MNVRTMLDCWASVVIVRAGGDHDAPTVDSALGTDERLKERVEEFNDRLSRWAFADDKGELDHQEATDLCVALALRRALEGDSPKTGRGRPTRDRDKGPSLTRRGPSTVFGAYLDVQRLMALYCASEAQSLGRLHQAVLKTHPRKGRYSGLGQKETYKRFRFDARFRREVSGFVKWAECQNETK